MRAACALGEFNGQVKNSYLAEAISSPPLFAGRVARAKVTPEVRGVPPAAPARSPEVSREVPGEQLRGVAPPPAETGGAHASRL
jgi:hypothetical protein